MTYSLRRVSDGAGDSGPMSVAIGYAENGTIFYEDHGRPRVGVAMRVGSWLARTYDPQDWWQTTFITEIIENNIVTEGTAIVGREIRFKTKNSEYIWKEF